MTKNLIKGRSSTPEDPGSSVIMRWLQIHLDYPHEDFCLIWPFGRTHGYGGLQIDGKHFYAHRYICERTHGPAPTPKHEAAHSCNRGHEACVNRNHIRWKTKGENHKEGEPHRKLKLLPEQAREIRDLKGLERPQDTADRFGIAESTVRNIQLGILWREGDRRGRAFRDAEVQRIRSLEGKISAVDLAKEYEVSRNVIYKIWRRHTWAHVPEAA